MAINYSKAFDWAVTTCNDPNVGYSQDYRNQQTVNGVTYYDCSSFIWYALLEAGFDCVGAYESELWGYTGNAITTGYMDEWLLALGFKEVNIQSEWKAGDILLRDGHTEMVHTGGSARGITMGAHSSSYALANQVSINTSYSSASSWVNLYRYEAGVIAESWIYGNRYLNSNEMKNNASLIYKYLSGKGWSTNAIAGLLGNMESESTINPGIWQSLNYGNTSGGFGLVQWTPSTNYTNWATSNGYDINDGYGQLFWIHNLTTSTGQWIKTDAYPISFLEFRTSSESPEYLASAFLKNFERAGVEVEAERRTQARSWYNYITTLGPVGPSYPIRPRKRTGGFNFVLFNYRRMKR